MTARLRDNGGDPLVLHPTAFYGGDPTDADAPQDEQWHPTVDELAAARDRAEHSGPGPIGGRTAADLPYGAPPPQLHGEFLTPEGPTILYGPGGVGKGITACWLALGLVRAGHVVMLLDFEGHEREWGSRLRGLGATDAELARIHYRAPFGQDWTAGTGSLADVAELVRDNAARLGVTYLVVDSYSVATSSGDTMGGQEAAREYFTGLTRIGLPSLTIAHVRGDSLKWPDRPFGSVFVHNLARETWAVEDGAKADDSDAGEDTAILPHLVQLEYRNKKASGRQRVAPQFVTFSFFRDQTIEVTEGRPAGTSVADRAADVLLGEEPMTLAQLRKAIKEDTGEDYREAVLRVTLSRQSDRFTVTKKPRPAVWSLR